MNIDKTLQEAAKLHRHNQELVHRLKRKKPKNLDDKIHTLHDEIFTKLDCLSCANCCKTTSPTFYMVDIDRISTHLRMKAQDFIAKFLRIDEDGDYILKNSPCPFLMDDNYCGIYRVRPSACKEYPHTNRKNMLQILDLTLQNSLICPAVAHIFNQLQKTNL